MKRRSFLRAAVLVLEAAAWLWFPAIGRSETPPTGAADPAMLVRALGDPAERVRFQAMAELMRIGRPATPELAQALSDVELITDDLAYAKRQDGLFLPLSRSDLAFAVLLNTADIDIDALLDAYRSTPPEPSVPPRTAESEPVSPRGRIRMVLEQVAMKPTDRVYEAFRSGDTAFRVTLAEVIGRAQGEAKAVPALAHAVAEDQDAAVRIAAASALLNFEDGPQSLRILIKHVEPRVRTVALAAYPANAKDSAELIARSLKDPAREVQQTALERISNPEPIQPASIFRAFPWMAKLHTHDFLCQLASDGPPALLTGLPGSALSDVVAFTQDGNVQIRRAAVQALGSLACGRRDIAPAAVEVLAEKVFDPATEVATTALDRLAKLAELQVVPYSSQALDNLLAGLADPAKAGHTEMLTVLEHMDLPEARQNEVVKVLVMACLSEQMWDCRSAQAILSTRPAWREAAVETLSSRYSDIYSFDSLALFALKDLGGDSPGSTRLLERLLDHPDKLLRAGAASTLAERGYNPSRLWDALEDGVRSYDGGWGWGRDAVQSLVRLGKPGIARLIAILRRSATKLQAREEIFSALSTVAAESKQTADFLLATAVSAYSQGDRTEAIKALTALKSRPVDVKIALKRAFAIGDAEARSTVVSVWEKTGQAPGDLVAQVFADPVPSARREAFFLLSLLHGDDPRRLTFTAAALRDKVEAVRDEALQFAGELGKPGAALLAQYAASGAPLSYQFFHEVEHLDTLGDELVSALEARAADAPAWELDRILSALNRAGAEAPEERKRLYALLDAADPSVRDLAAKSLLTLGENPWARDEHLAAALMEAGVHELVKQRLYAAFKVLYSFSEEHTAYLVAPRIPMPRIPWPPPAGYRPPLVVSRELLGSTGSTTLAEVYGRLAGALEAVSDGFEHGLFLGPAGGFAVVARMERIKSDGTPFPEPARWLKEGSPKLSLMDFLADLFFESPGYFRIIVFVVTSDLVPGHDRRATLPEPVHGAPAMPAELARLPFEGKEVLALVYSFERRPDSKVTPWEDGAPSARQHLEKSGVWGRLGTSARR